MTLEETQDKVAQLIRNLLNPVEDKILDLPLQDMGADSLDRVELALMLERDFHVPISDADEERELSCEATPRAIAAWIFRQSLAAQSN